MDFDKKYPDAKIGHVYDDNIKKFADWGVCHICQESTKWEYYWKNTYLGIPHIVTKRICSDECLEYYSIMKELMT